MSSSEPKTVSSSFTAAESTPHNFLYGSGGDESSETTPGNEEKPQVPVAASSPELDLGPSEKGLTTDVISNVSPQSPGPPQEPLGPAELSADVHGVSSSFEGTERIALEEADFKTKEEIPSTDQEPASVADTLLHETTPALLPSPPSETDHQESFFEAMSGSESDAFSTETEDPFAALDLAFDKITQEASPPPLHSSLTRNQSSNGPQTTGGLPSPYGAPEAAPQDGLPSPPTGPPIVFSGHSISPAQSPITLDSSFSASTLASVSPASLLGNLQNEALTLPWLPNHGHWNPSIPNPEGPSHLSAIHDDTEDLLELPREREGESTAEEPKVDDETGLILEEIPPLWVGFTRKRIASAVTAALVLGLFFGLWFGPNTGPDETTQAGRAEINFAEGNRLFQENLPDAALAKYRSAIGDGFEGAAIFRAKGASLAKQRRFSEAAKAYEEYLARHPEAKDRIEIEESLRAFYAKDGIP